MILYCITFICSEKRRDLIYTYESVTQRRHIFSIVVSNETSQRNYGPTNAKRGLLGQAERRQTGASCTESRCFVSSAKFHLHGDKLGEAEHGGERVKSVTTAWRSERQIGDER